MCIISITFGEYFEGNIFDEKNDSFISSLNNNLFIKTIGVINYDRENLIYYIIGYNIIGIIYHSK